MTITQFDINAAKLQAKLLKQLGETVPADVQALADASPDTLRNPSHGKHEKPTDAEIQRPAAGPSLPGHAIELKSESGYFAFVIDSLDRVEESNLKQLRVSALEGLKLSAQDIAEHAVSKMDQIGGLSDEVIKPGSASEVKSMPSDERTEMRDR